MPKMNETYRTDKDEKYRKDPEVMKVMDKGLKDRAERERREIKIAVGVFVMLCIIMVILWLVVK